MPATVAQSEWIERYLNFGGARSADASPKAANDPAAPVGPALTPAQCEAAIKQCGSSWKKVKEEYLKKPEVMAQLIAYRKATVDGIIRLLDEQAGGKLVAKSVGTTNLTSDYDITLSTLDGSGAEIDAVVSFNDEIKRIFGVPPGVCFDTNLYVKDFLDVKDKSILGTEEAPRHDKKALDALADEMLQMDRSDQDVGALTKQRQYMSTTQWLAYKDGILAGLKDLPDSAKAIAESTIQFEEAENIYLIKAAEKAERFFAALDKSPPTGVAPEAMRELADLRRRWTALSTSGDTAAGEAMHHLVDEVAELSHEHFDAAALEANNELYMEKMFAARDIQRQQKEQQAKLDALPDKASPEAKELSAEIEALKTRAKKEITDGNFFASEAYLSEGPLQHIVAGNQSGDKSAIAKLKPEHFLGSINEQFGDFMKDVGHYAANEAEAFCQTSKYLHRMLEGVALLMEKPGFGTLTLKAVPVASLKTMMDQIAAQLLPIRGAKDAWADKTDEARFAAAATAAKTIFKVGSLADLTAFANALCMEVNAAVRKAIAADGGMRGSKEQDAAFFANRDKETERKRAGEGR